MKSAIFVLGTYERDAIHGSGGRTVLCTDTAAFLSGAADAANLDAEIIFAVTDPWLAGSSKTKISMRVIREERERVVSEISMAKPDLVVAFGPVAAASVLDKGNMTENELLRAEHRPFGDDGPPVYCTFGIENIRTNPGLEEWVRLDLMAAASGRTGTEWGDYTILRPGTPEWSNVPQGLIDLPLFLDYFPEWKTITQSRTGEVAIGFDLETAPGLDPWHPTSRIRMAVLSDRVGRAWVVLADPASNLPDWVRDIAQDKTIVKCGSNIKYDSRWLRRFGTRMVNMRDTSTIEHVLCNTNPHTNLKFLSLRYVPKLGDYSRGQRILVKERGGWEYVTDQEMIQYAGGDGEASIGSYRGQVERVKQDGLQRPVKLLNELYPVLCDMEHSGACIDLEENARLRGLYEEKLVALRNQITQALGPINPNSTQQLADALYRAVPGINLSPRKMKRALADDESEEASTARFILERESHRHPVLASILEFRRYRVRHSTFIVKLREKYATQHPDGKWYVHPSFNTAVTDTYRLSSSQPNGQNIPRKDNDDPELSVKRQFVSRFAGGRILEADQSQLELRFAAWLSGDEAMLRALASGEDIHRAMAAIMLSKAPGNVSNQERQECKTRTFLILYGGGAFKLAQDLKIPVKRAKDMVSEYYRTFYGLGAYIKRVQEQVKRDLQVTTSFGFVRRFQAPRNWESSEGWMIQRQAFNTMTQSGAASLEYCSAIALSRDPVWQSAQSVPILLVHDSTVIDVHPDDDMAAIITAVRRSKEVGCREVAKEIAGVDFGMPLACDISIGRSWGETQPV